MSPAGSGRLAYVPFAAVATLHLAGHLAGAADTWTAGTQLLLMPALALWLFAATRSPRSREVRWGFGALGFSWLGDGAPQFTSGTTGFLLMVGFFLVAQVLYAIAFLPHRGRSILRRPLWLIPYVALALGLVALCAPKAGSLLPVIAVYAAAIVCMAVLATGLGWAGVLGGALFVLSDGLIAVRAFAGLTLPAHTFWVMLTYLAAQLLLAQAIQRTQRPSAP